MPADGDFRPTASLDTLRLRAQLLTRVREFFATRSFLEVETPILSRDMVVDRHLDPFVTVLAPDARKPDVGERLFLQTSPEFHMKRLLAAGAGSIYQVSRVFRNGEIGRSHNPEFTLVEWYQVGVDYQQGLSLLGELCHELLARGPAEIVTYQAAFMQYAAVDPHRTTVAELQQVADRAGISVPSSLTKSDRDGWLDLLLVELVERHLGRGRPTILCDYPASQAALARTRIAEGGVEVAERFELYVDGIELANGYHELLDPQVLRSRTRQNNELRQQDGKPPLPEQNQLLTAMQAGLPDSVGVALGFDRIVMLAAGCHSISEVMSFPIERA